jgi:DNA-binding beta-propeller fold protein YncE
MAIRNPGRWGLVSATALVVGVLGSLGATAATADAATGASAAESCQPANVRHLAYSTNLDSAYDSVSVVNTSTDKVVRSIGGFDVPANVTPTSDGSKLYVDDWHQPGTADTKVVNPCTGKIVKSIPRPGGLFPLTNLSPNGRWLYLSAVQGFDIERIDTRTDKVVQTYSTLQLGALEPIGYAVPSPDEKTLWVAGLHDVFTIDLNTGKTVGTEIPVGISPEWLAFTPDGSRLIATNFAGGTDSIIDTASRSVIATADIGLTSYPNSAGATPDGTQFWVGNLDGTVSVIDARTGRLVRTIHAGKMMSLDVTFSRDGSKAYVDTVPKSSTAINPNGAVTAFGLMVTGLYHAGPGEFAVYDTKTYRKVDSIRTGGLPSPLITPSGPF